MPADPSKDDNKDADTPDANVPANKPAADANVNNGATQPVNVETTKSDLTVVTPVATAPAAGSVTEAALPTREAYKAQQAKSNTNSDTLPQTGNSTKEAGLLSAFAIGLSMFGLGLRKRQ